MNALARFEHVVESLLERPFTRLMRSQLQPVEVAKRLARSMETEQVISAGKTIVPNSYHVALHREDFRPFETSKQSWEHELAEYVAAIAQERGWTLFGRPTVVLEAGEAIAPRQVQITARVIDPPAASPVSREELGFTKRIDPAAVRAAIATPKGVRLVVINGPIAGLSFPIVKPVLLVGRAIDNDIVLEDPGVSRYHAEIRLREGQLVLRDVRSTNGTTVNGQSITEVVLTDGDRISIASIDLLFRIES